jgi:uncharacterized protein
VELDLPIVPANSSCKDCGKPFHCDIRDGKETCWCFEYQTLPGAEMVFDATCYCPSCLKKRIESVTC